MSKILAINCILFLCFCLESFGQSTENIVIRGIVSDQNSGNPLPFANLLELHSKQGTTTDKNGRFRITFPTKLLKHNADSLEVKVAFVGFKTKVFSISLKETTNLNFRIEQDIKELKTLKIIGQKFQGDQLVRNTAMGTTKLKVRTILDVPTITGEPDVIKTMQLLPGTTKGVDGGSDFFVRGGDADQNLILLDGTTVYNTGHLLGFMSVFNPDILSDVEIVKGAFPAHLGGRLSSIVNIATHHQFSSKTSVEGSIGVISSRVTLKQPIIKDKLNIMLAYRRTYIDKLLEAIDNPDLQVPYFFYDFNGKIQFRSNSKNTFSFSNYGAIDKLTFANQGRRSRNRLNSEFEIKGNSQTFQWKHLINESKDFVLHASRVSYKYFIDTSFGNESFFNSIVVNSDLEDYDFKITVNQKIREDHNIKYGFHSILHQIAPSRLTSEGIIASILPSNRSDGLTASETAIFGSYDFLYTPIFRFNIGYRQSFSLSNDVKHTVAEPRFSMSYYYKSNQTFKFAYSRNAQYVHRVSSSSLSLPVDLWYTVTNKIKPQSANQISLGYTRSFSDRNIYLETETYFKSMKNLTAYEEGTNLLFNTSFENALIQGKGRSYGIELLIKKESERFNGWIAYTLSKSDRQFDILNNGKRFPARYDRRHNVSVVGTYNLTKRLKVSMIWEFLSGSNFTAIIGQYATLKPDGIGVDLFNIYSDRNAIRLSNSHRLDLSISWRNKITKKWKSEWQIGVYNVYNQTSPINLIIDFDEEGQYSYKEIGLFGTLPSITYNFSF